MNEPPPGDVWVEQRYPVAFDVEPQTTGRNRLTVFFRLILAIPHFVIVGGPLFGGGGNQQLDETTAVILGLVLALLSTGLLTVAAWLVSIIAWFAIIITGTHPRGLWKFARFYMRWKTNVLAYAGLLRDEYPPFGEGDYPVQYEVDYPDHRIRWTALIRFILAIPHVIVLIFLQIAWVVTVVIGWFAILFTGNYPAGLYKFAVGYFRWETRVNSYLFLLRDEYPPFSLDP